MTNLWELLIPVVIALGGGFITGMFARRYEKSKATNLDSETLLKWAQEFRDAQADTRQELDKYKDRSASEITNTRSQLEVANARIDELEEQVRNAVRCNQDLQRDLDAAGVDRKILQDRVTILETENAELKRQIEGLKRGKRGAQ